MTSPNRVALALLQWYDAGKRDLPWRREASAYRTLVSELMLQQTVVATVVPYFERFVRRFPDLRALAAASEEDVLALWSGLGYYARARNLHRTARRVVEEHGGELPGDEAALRRLPGVGEYTAAAIASISFGQRTFPLDGNAARVMARLVGEDRAIDLPAVRAALRARGQALVPADRPGDFAQAVMELGALVCVASTAPRCQACPVARSCAARAQGRAGELPVRLAKRPRRAVELVCVGAVRRGRVLLVRRAAGELLAGTWSLPAADSEAGESDEGASRRALAALGLAARGPAVRAGVVRHIFTHRDVTARVVRAGVTGTPTAAEKARWVSRDELANLALSSFARKMLAVLDIAQ